MRVLLPFMALLIAVCLVAPACCFAVGYYDPTREPYRPTKLAARGEIPDVLNQLKEGLYFKPLVNFLDRIAVEVKGVLSQFGVRTQENRYERRMTVTSDIKRRKPRKYRRSKRR